MAGHAAHLQPKLIQLEAPQFSTRYVFFKLTTDAHELLTLLAASMANAHSDSEKAVPRPRCTMSGTAVNVAEAHALTGRLLGGETRPAIFVSSARLEREALIVSVAVSANRVR